MTKLFFYFWPVLFVKLIGAKEIPRFLSFENFHTMFLVVIFEIEISWLNFWTEEEMVWCCSYIYFFPFLPPLRVILTCWHDNDMTRLRVFQGGRVALLNFAYWDFVFFIYIFLVVVALSQGSSLLVLKKMCDNLARLSLVFKKKPHTPKKHV